MRIKMIWRAGWDIALQSPYRWRALGPSAFTKSPSRFAATVSLASVRPLAAISSAERRIRVASGCAASQKYEFAVLF